MCLRRLQLRFFGLNLENSEVFLLYVGGNGWFHRQNTWNWTLQSSNKLKRFPTSKLKIQQSSNHLNDTKTSNINNLWIKTSRLQRPLGFPTVLPLVACRYPVIVKILQGNPPHERTEQRVAKYKVCWSYRIQGFTLFIRWSFCATGWCRKSTTSACLTDKNLQGALNQIFKCVLAPNSCF